MKTKIFSHSLFSGIITQTTVLMQFGLEGQLQAVYSLSGA